MLYLTRGSKVWTWNQCVRQDEPTSQPPTHTRRRDHGRLGSSMPKRRRLALIDITIVLICNIQQLMTLEQRNQIVVRIPECRDSIGTGEKKTSHGAARFEQSGHDAPESQRGNRGLRTRPTVGWIVAQSVPGAKVS